MNSNVLTSLQALFQFMGDCDWKNNLEDCLTQQLSLERRFLVAVIEEQNPKCLIEAAKWLLRRDPGRVEWLEPLLKGLMSLLDKPVASLHIILGLIYHFTGYDDRAVEQFRLAEDLTADLTPVKLMVWSTRDSAVQMEYAKKWEEREPGELVSEIIQVVSQTGKVVSSDDLINRIPNSIDFDAVDELEKLASPQE